LSFSPDCRGLENRKPSALEDLGAFCVDNLPVTLLPMLAELTLRPVRRRSRARRSSWTCARDEC
jgi:hypothetical protein